MSLDDLLKIPYGKTAIELKSISLAFGGVKALTDVSFGWQQQGAIISPFPSFPKVRCCRSEVRFPLLSSAFVPAARVRSKLYAVRAATFILPAVVTVYAMGLIAIVLFPFPNFPNARCCPSEVRFPLLSSASVAAARVRSKLYAVRVAALFKQLPKLLQWV